MIIDARLCVILFYAVTLTLIKGDYFNGGTLTYQVSQAFETDISISVTQTYLYKYSEVYCNDTMIGRQLSPLVHNGSSDTFNCSRHCNQAGEFLQSPRITSRCTDYSKSLDITVGQRTDLIHMTDDLYFLIVLRSGSWHRLSLPIELAEPLLWSVSCSIMLRRKSNGEYNQPPVATMISPIYIPVGILQAIYIPTIDTDDNDEVRCRFAGDADECGDVCYPASLPNGTELLSNCTLLITGEKEGDWYGVTIMVEDFLDSTSANPLSSIPVQFLISVQNESACRPPLLTGPVTESGQCIGVLVDEPFIIQLKVENFCSNTTTIQDIATLSFPNVKKTLIVQNTTSIWLMSLIWRPTREQIGLQVLCAVAVDSNNFQSNQYCITFTVAEESISPCPRDKNMPTTQFTTIDSTSISTTIDSTSDLLTQSTTVLSLVTSINTFDSPQIFSTPSPDDDYTDLVIVLPPSESPSPWLWASPLIAVLAACLIALCVWFYCCYPSSCCCKHRQKRSPTKQMTRQDQSTQTPNTYTVYEVANNETNSNINNVHQARPWNIKNNHTSRVTPTSTSPLNNVQHPTSTAQIESYIFGNRHTSKSNEQ